MSRPRRIPSRGDVAASAVADLLGLSLADFNSRETALRERGFPEPDPTTGLYCIEAVDRLLRNRLESARVLALPSLLECHRRVDPRMMDTGRYAHVIDVGLLFEI